MLPWVYTVTHACVAGGDGVTHAWERSGWKSCWRLRWSFRIACLPSASTHSSEMSVWEVAWQRVREVMVQEVSWYRQPHSNLTRGAQQRTSGSTAKLTDQSRIRFVYTGSSNFTIHYINMKIKCVGKWRMALSSVFCISVIYIIRQYVC